MSVPASVVVTATAVVASPLLWLVYDGAVPLDVALQRLVVCLVACWALLGIVGALAFSPPKEQRPDQAAAVVADPPTGPVPPTAETAPQPGT
ncbi:MAG: hypothetical protein JWR42_2180 [Marmoricola sp.]|nr:hypothetical protein [Marmoricola sp.]